MKKITAALITLLTFSTLSLTAFADIVSPPIEDIKIYDPSVFFDGAKNIVISCLTGAGILALVAMVIMFIIKQMKS